MVIIVTFYNDNYENTSLDDDYDSGVLDDQIVGNEMVTMEHVRNTPVRGRSILDSNITRLVTPSVGIVTKLSDDRMMYDDIMTEEEGKVMKNGCGDMNYEQNGETGGDDEQVMSMRDDVRSVKDDGVLLLTQYATLLIQFILVERYEVLLRGYTNFAQKLIFWGGGLLD